MRKVLALLAAILTILAPKVVSAQTTFWVESSNKLTLNHGSSIEPQINASASTSFNSKVGLFLWVADNTQWGEAYAGPTLQLAKGIQVGAGIGVETDARGDREDIFALFYGNGRSLYMTAETGGSGPWYQVEGNQSVTLGKTPAGVGFRYERFVGIGPRVELTVDKHILLWAVPLAVDFENDNGRNALYGLRILF